MAISILLANGKEYESVQNKGEEIAAFFESNGKEIKPSPKQKKNFRKKVRK